MPTCTEKSGSRDRTVVLLATCLSGERRHTVPISSTAVLVVLTDRLKKLHTVASGIPTAVGNSEGESPPYDCTACTHVFSCCCWSSCSQDEEFEKPSLRDWRVHGARSRESGVGSRSSQAAPHVRAPFSLPRQGAGLEQGEAVSTAWESSTLTSPCKRTHEQASRDGARVYTPTAWC